MLKSLSFRGTDKSGSIVSIVVLRVNLLVFKCSEFHVQEVIVNVCDEAIARESVLLGAFSSTGVDFSEFCSLNLVLVQSSRKKPQNHH